MGVWIVLPLCQARGNLGVGKGRSVVKYREHEPSAAGGWLAGTTEMACGHVNQPGLEKP